MTYIIFFIFIQVTKIKLIFLHTFILSKFFSKFIFPTFHVKRIIIIIILTQIKTFWFQVKPFYGRSKSFASPCNHTVPFHQPLNLKPANTTWTTVTISIDVVSTRVAGSFQEESSWPIEASIRGTRRLINGMRQAKNWSRISGWHRLYPGWLTSVLDYSSGTTFDRDTSRGGMATFIFWCTSAIPCATSSLTTSPRSKWKTTVAAFDLPAKVSIWIRGERRQGRICIILHRETRIPCNGSIGNRHAIMG